MPVTSASRGPTAAYGLCMCTQACTTHAHTKHTLIQICTQIKQILKSASEIRVHVLTHSSCLGMLLCQVSSRNGPGRFSLGIMRFPLLNSGFPLGKAAVFTFSVQLMTMKSLLPRGP